MTVIQLHAELSIGQRFRYAAFSRICSSFAITLFFALWKSNALPTPGIEQLLLLGGSFARPAGRSRSAAVAEKGPNWPSVVFSQHQSVPQRSNHF